VKPQTERTARFEAGRLVEFLRRCPAVAAVTLAVAAPGAGWIRWGLLAAAVAPTGWALVLGLVARRRRCHAEAVVARAVTTHAAALIVAVAALALFVVGLLTTGPASAATDGYAAVCPEAPPGTQEFMDDITAWVKWGVLALIVLAAIISIGSILAGRIFSHPHASRYGAMGIAVTIIAAILYTVVLVVLDSITGTGCT